MLKKLHLFSHGLRKIIPLIMIKTDSCLSCSQQDSQTLKMMESMLRPKLNEKKIRLKVSSWLIIIDATVETSLSMNWLPCLCPCSVPKIIKWTRQMKQFFPTLASLKVLTDPLVFTDQPCSSLMVDGFSTWWRGKKAILGRRLLTVTWAICSILTGKKITVMFDGYTVAYQKIITRSSIQRTPAVMYIFNWIWWIWHQGQSSWTTRVKSSIFSLQKHWTGS